MTYDEFITQALTFPIGQIVVVSGPDTAQVNQLLIDAATAMENQGAVVIDLNSRSEITYKNRYLTDQVEFSNSLQGRIWEYLSLISQNSMIILVTNYFDINNPRSNLTNINLIVDVVYDMYDAKKVKKIPTAFSRRFGGVREIFPFISQLYYYDLPNENIIFIKNQIPNRPCSS